MEVLSSSAPLRARKGIFMRENLGRTCAAGPAAIGPLIAAGFGPAILCEQASCRGSGPRDPGASTGSGSVAAIAGPSEEVRPITAVSGRVLPHTDARSPEDR
ncbi:hypothetical protein GCM10023193_29190 [Planotetraspora kaengkrachanensis]|uniref:Uncharacterized protein n=1 Tax=Planotetraspora kaengkrachanensis TaxID=575193 RepID=A0A8J3LTD0_9ACTN|nr:hypothetical protein Pka01_18850 [Planotetraspora kaengkrachanensis]